MGKVIWTAKAVSHLESIYNYIAHDSHVYASRFIKALISQTKIIETFPISGRIVPEFSDKFIREIIYNNYRIVYRIKDSSNPEILAVMHGSQLIENSLSRENNN